MTAPSEDLHGLHQQARALLSQLHPLAAQSCLPVAPLSVVDPVDTPSVC